MVSMFGENGARVVYGLAGSAFCFFGFLDLAGVIEINNADDPPSAVQRAEPPTTTTQPQNDEPLATRAERARATLQKWSAQTPPTPQRPAPSPSVNPDTSDDFDGVLPSFGGEGADQTTADSDD